MFVSKRMTKYPVTVPPDTTLVAAIGIMQQNKFRRLPVIEDGKLVGFLNDHDLMRVAPSPATSLSRYETKEILGKLTVADIMRKNIVTVDDDATIEEAALVMYNNKISALPVLSKSGVLTGIITETDIFKTFVDVMGLIGGKTRITIEVENKVGVLKDIADIFFAAGLSLDSCITCKQPDGKYEIVVRGSIAESDKITEAIEQKGYKVIHTVKIG